MKLQSPAKRFFSPLLVRLGKLVFAVGVLLLADAPVLVHAQTEAVKARYAIEKGSDEALKQLLIDGLDPNTKIEGTPLLNLAVTADFPRLPQADPFAAPGGEDDLRRLNIVKVLLDSKIDIDQTDQRGQTAIFSLLNRRLPEPEIVAVILAEKPDVTIAPEDGYPLIMLAAGLPDTLKKMIDLGADSNASHPQSKKTVLMSAAGFASLESIRILIASGAEANRKDKSGENAVHSLARHKANFYVTSETVISCLDVLEKAGAVTDLASKTGETPLHQCVDHKNPQIIRWLLKRNPKVDVVDHEGRTPLHIAMKAFQSENIQVLLDAGASPDIAGPDGSALTIAAKAFHEWPVSVDVYMNGGKLMSDEYGFDPSVHYGMKKIVKMAKDFDAADDEGRTPLMWAAVADFPEAVNLLLQKGGDPKIRSQDGRNILMWAACGNAVSVIELLLKRGIAETEARDHSGKSALDWAKELENNGAATLLAKHLKTEVPDLIAAIFSGSDDEALKLIAVSDFNPWQRHFGATALHFAAEHGRLRIVAALLKKTPNSVNLIDSTGASPLMWAVMNEHLESITILLENGAAPLDPENLEIKGRYRSSPENALLWAVHKHNREIIRKLLAKCPRISQLDKSARIINKVIEEGDASILNLLLSSKLFTIQPQADKLGSRVYHPLETASAYDSIPMFQAIAKYVGEDKIRSSHLLQSSLAAASRSASLEMVKFLVESFGANVSSKVKPETKGSPFAESRDDSSPLGSAIFFQRIENIAYLLEKGASPNAEDLHSSIFSNTSTVILENILTVTKDVDAIYEGRTALMKAAGQGNLASAKLLLKKGADFQKKDTEGKSVLDYAIEGGNKKLIGLIKDAINSSPSK